MVKVHVLLLLLVSYSVAESQNVELNSFKNQSGECFDSQSFESQESNENSSEIVIVSEETFEDEYYVNSPNSTQDYDSKEVIYGSPCPENEVFNGCINSGCTPQNCSQLGYPVPCLLLDPKFCQKGCTCAEGFLRSTNGTCVLLDDCDVPCGGDPNAVPGCGTNCGCHCSDIGNIPVACKQICDPNGCDCKPGFVFDDQTNKCVSPDQCSSTSETDSIVIVSEESSFEDVSSSSSTEDCSESESTEEIIDEPTCQDNEVFNSCVNGGCFPHNCSQLGYPVPCVKLDPKYCRKGCTCQDGYLRSRNGTCVLKENCDSPCGGDPNSTPGCGSNCGRRCSNYNKGLLACPFSCNINGCDCKKGYIFDDNIKKCVKPEECTPTCKKNEVFNSCTNSGCVPQNCSQLGYPVPCVRLDPKFCKKGCTCEEGYLRSENGTCVLKEDCNTPCGGDPNAVPGCGTNCGSRCSDIGKVAVPCALICNLNGCDCKPGFVLDNKSNKCVRPDQCTPTCKKNEVFNSCTNSGCVPQNCSQLGYPVPCVRLDPKFCKKGCTCEEGYLRSENGTCVLKEDCNTPCGGDPNAVPGCGTNCGSRCSDIGKVAVPCALICNLNGCDCKPGFVLDNKTNKCVRPDQCTIKPPSCPVNEEYSTCSNAIRRAQNCSQKDVKVPCNAVSKCDKGCVCKENYYRGANGTCVPKNQCPTSCGGDPNAVPGCGTNCGKRCSDIGKAPGPCPLICNLNGCDCKPGFVLDDNTKKCVKPDKCSAVCKQNEVYSSCINGGCDRRNCSQLKEPQLCIDLIEGGCIGGCVCEKGYLRNGAGVCVLENKCPASCGGDPNAVPGCGVNCGKRCSDIGKGPVACILVCYVNGCDCKPGYVLDDNTKKCVRPDECSVKPPLSCPVNEEYSNCSNAICRAQHCSQINQSIPCNAVSKCDKGCVCKENYYRGANGTCVPKNQCPTSCGGDPNAVPGCGTNCGKRCSDIDKAPGPCPLICNLNGCDCKPGFVLDDNTKKCVKPDKCSAVCKQNEVYSSCINGGCDRRNCSQLKEPQLCIDLIEGGCIGGCVCEKGYLRNGVGVCVLENKCPEISCLANEVFNSCAPPLDTISCINGTIKKSDLIQITLCTQRCVCQKGFVRNIKGECISEANCQKCKGPKEYYSCGGFCDNECAKLSTQNQTNCPVVNIKCNEKCYCEEGHARDKNNVCIPIGKCPGTATNCGPNEEYATCGNHLCRPQNCSQKAKKLYCPAVVPNDCIRKCVCKVGFLKDKNNVCVPEKQCPAIEVQPTCGPNEEYSSCGNGICRAQNCTDKYNPIACPQSQEVSCRRGCICKEHFLRNATGVCVPEDQCAVCPEGERYSTCPAKPCDAEYCPKSRNDPQACISTRECSKPRCVCGFNQKRVRSSGKCIPISQCPSFPCGPNEEYNSCPPVCPGQNCSDFLNNSTCPRFKIGIVVPCKPACRCIKNYYRNLNGICIKESKCSLVPTPTCPINEEYSNCSNAVCRAQYCSQINQSTPCNAVSKCDKGCVCKENFYRGANGTCIPKNQCPTSCGGDPNAVPGCGVNCGKRCSDIGKGPVACILVCYVNGCDCKPGYVLDDNTKKCVRPDECSVKPPLSCPVNEEYSNCSNAICRAQHCSQINQSIPCNAVSKCDKGCVCKENYYRGANGTCVPKNQCPKISCLANEVFNSCAPPLDTISCINGTIKKSDLIQITLCTQRCVCQKGFVRNIKGECISEANCQKCKGPKEYYSCGGFCDNECAKLSTQNQTNCPVVNIKCNEKCYCEEGHARDKNNVCIPIGKCPGTATNCGPNEEYATCGNHLCRPQNCSQKAKKLYCPAVVPNDCIRKCVCKVGFLKDKNNVCVPEKQCPAIEVQPTCGPNEEYSSCGNGICRAQNCTDKYNPIACPQSQEVSCRRGCICKEHFLRNATGVCVPEDQCAVCPEGERYLTCPAKPCDAEYCPKSRNDPQACISTRECSKPRCVCGFNQKRERSSGKCIPISQCPSFPCGPNEEYNSCPPVCPGQNCSDFLNNSTCPRFKIGIVVPCKPACRCIKNYYRNLNGICIKESKCSLVPTPTCPINEEYSNCSNAVCRAQYCSQINQSTPCNAVSKCDKGCVCKENFYRGANGTCIPKNQCPTSCGGDPNAVPGCGVNCGKRCSDIGKGPVACILVCYVNGCDCKPGYVLDDNTKKCVRPDECSVKPPLSCPVNEEYSNCSNAICRAQHCSQINQSIPCNAVSKCDKGCVCKENYYRGANGTCVPKNQCPKISCLANEVFNSCAPPLDTISCINGTIKKSDLIQIMLCTQRCVCQKGFVRNIKGECISEANCQKCKGPKEYYSCGGFCDNECAKLSTQNQTNCPVVNIKCNEKCYCEEGHARDKNNVCIPIGKCPGTATNCGPNEEYATCGNHLCRPQNCSQKAKKLYCPAVVPNDCIRKCVCKVGFLKDKNNVCVPEKQCPAIEVQPTCGPNEEYSSCGNGICRAQNCTDKYNPIACPQSQEVSCRRGCICKEHFLRNATGVCVPEDQCAVCPEGERYSTCPAKPCDAEYCPKSRNDPQACISTRECSKPRCVCGLNQKRERSSGKCIPISQCPSFPCGPNEEYNSCPPVCPGQNCSDFLNNSTCPRFKIGIVVPCKPACRCIKNYYRNLNGICIKESKCSTAVCGRNEEYSTCKNSLCGGQNCSDLGKKSHCPLVTKENCQGGCICKRNYLRKNGVCVPQDQCQKDEPDTGCDHKSN